MRKLFINPLFLYGVSFLISLSLYELRWSDLYPDLSDELFYFLLSTVFISLILSFVLNFFIKEKKYDVNITQRNSYIICFFISLGFIAEYIYARQIPIISVLFGSEMNYKEFGIPTFHVFLLPYASVFTIISTFRFIENKKKRYFLYSAVYTFILIGTIMNRGALIIILAAIGIIILYKNFSLKYIVILSIFGLAILYGFGVLGNKRMIASGYQDELAVLSVASASNEFKENWVPNEFFWGYLYSTVSIANLQNQVNSYHIDGEKGKLSDILMLEIFPDFISKRLYSDDEVDVFKPDLIKEELTTYTIYGRAIKIFGITGSIILYLWLLIFCFFSSILSPTNYRIPIMALLSIIIALSIFANMLVFSGALLQVLLAIVLLTISSRRISLL